MDESRADSGVRPIIRSLRRSVKRLLAYRGMSKTYGWGTGWVAFLEGVLKAAFFGDLADRDAARIKCGRR